VTSHVLNEGVDVPDARIAILLSGTGSAREYIQRLGRVLRRGSEANKQAILYEVVTEATSEERTSERRRGIERSHPQPEPQPDKVVQIGIKYDKDIPKKRPIAADSPNDYVP
jgi:superfamily II DNA or RNA helicase